MNLENLDIEKLKEIIQKRNQEKKLEPIYRLILDRINKCNIGTAQLLFSFLETMKIPVEDAEDFLRCLAGWESFSPDDWFLYIRQIHLLKELTKDQKL